MVNFLGRSGKRKKTAKTPEQFTAAVAELDALLEGETKPAPPAKPAARQPNTAATQEFAEAVNKLDKTLKGADFDKAVAKLDRMLPEAKPKDKPRRKPNRAPKPVSEQAKPAPPQATTSPDVVQAIRTLGERIAQIAADKPERKPVPFKFTLQRDKNGLLVSAVATPIEQAT